MAERKLVAAVKAQDINQVTRLINGNALKSNLPTSCEVLLAAIRTSNLELINIILETPDGVDPNKEIPMSRQTPLQVAAESDLLETSRALLKAGADVDKYTSRYQQTPMLIAAANNYTDEIVRLLSSNGANTGATDPVQGSSIVMVAAGNRYCVNILKYLVGELGLPINNVDDMGETPLFYAAAQGSLRNFVYLLEKGANIEHRTAGGENVFFKATMANNTPVCCYLIYEKKKDPYEKNNGTTYIDLVSNDQCRELMIQAYEAQKNHQKFSITDYTEPGARRHIEFKDTTSSLAYVEKKSRELAAQSGSMQFSAKGPGGGGAASSMANSNINIQSSQSSNASSMASKSKKKCVIL